MNSFGTSKYCKKCDQDHPVTPDFWYFRGAVPFHPCRSCQILRAREDRANATDGQRSARREKYGERQEEHRDNAASFAAENRELLRDRQKAFRQNHKERLNAELREKRRPVRDELAARGRAWRKENPDKSRQYRMTRAAKPGFAAHDSIGRALREILKGNGSPKTKSKQKLLGWNTDDLVAHFEMLFEEGMSFENYGEWEVDHIVAKSLIPFEDENDIMFKMVWSLDNLAPLWALDNREKNNRTDWVLPAHYKNEKLRARYASPIPELKNAILTN